MNDYDTWWSQSGEQWPALYSLAETFLAGARSLTATVEVRPHEKIKIMRALLFGRVISGTEGLVRLCRFGLLIEADILYRSNLEALFRLASLFEDESMLDLYLSEDYPLRRRGLKDVRTMLNNCSPRPAGAISNADIDRVLRDIGKEETKFLKDSKLAKCREVKAWEWARAGNQVDFFHGKYVLHSQVAHHSARDLERRIRLTENGDGIDALLFHPETESPVDCIREGLFLLARAIQVYAVGAGVEIDAGLEQAKQDLDKLFDEAVSDGDSAPHAP